MVPAESWPRRQEARPQPGPWVCWGRLTGLGGGSDPSPKPTGKCLRLVNSRQPVSASLSPPTAVLQRPGDLAAYDTVHLPRGDAPLRGPTSTLQLRIQAVYAGASAVGTAESVHWAAERAQHLSRAQVSSGGCVAQVSVPSAFASSGSISC